MCWKLFSQTDMDPHNICSIIYRAMTCMERKKSTHFCHSEEPMAERVAIEFWILLNGRQAVLPETHICIAQLCHTFLVLVSLQKLHKLYGAAVSKKSLYTSGMHYLNLGALGRWAVLLETPHSHRSITARF